jgi:hypothetical protein
MTFFDKTGVLFSYFAHRRIARSLDNEFLVTGTAWSFKTKRNSVFRDEKQLQKLEKIIFLYHHKHSTDPLFSARAAYSRPKCHNVPPSSFRSASHTQSGYPEETRPQPETHSSHSNRHSSTIPRNT